MVNLGLLFAAALFLLSQLTAIADDNNPPYVSRCSIRFRKRTRAITAITGRC
jgi:hypothetical protein